MKKVLIGLTAAAAIATPLAVAGSASAAAVAGCQETAVATTATFDAVQPAGAYNQWDNLWHHSYTVTVQPNGTFTGTGVLNGQDQNETFTNEPETISGTFTDGADTDTVVDQVTFTAIRKGDVAYTLTNAWLGTGDISVAAVSVNGQPVATQQPVEFKVSVPPQYPTISPAKAATTHTEYQWKTLVAKGGLHWEYKYTVSTKNPTTDIFHVWVKSLDLTKRGLPQITKTVEDTPAKDATTCSVTTATGDATWKYGEVTGTINVNANVANGGSFDYTDSTDQMLHGVVTPGTLVKNGSKVTFTGTITASNLEWNINRPFTVVVIDGDVDQIGVFVDRAVDDILADVTAGNLTIH